MKWICVREFGLHKPGSVVELPDGASVDPEHWEVVADEKPAPPPPAAPILSAAAIAPKGF